MVVTQTDNALQQLAAALGQQLLVKEKMICCAESCTGGWLAQVITSQAGSSGWFERGFVTYSNQAKQEMLGVRSTTLDKFGAVSQQVVREMSEGALQHSQADLSVAITGIAGPDGGSDEKPVGTVCLGWSSREGQTRSETHLFSGDREQVRRQAVACAIEGCLNILRTTK